MEKRIKNFFDGQNVDRNTPIPLHFQLKNIISNGISSSVLKPGDCLPTELDFAKYYNISRTTVRQALISLVSDGALYRIKSKGTFVSQPKADLHYVTSIESFESQILQSGMIPKTKILLREIEHCTPEISSMLSIKEGDRVIHLERLRYIDNVPAVIARSYHPYDICEKLMMYNLEEKSLLWVLSQKSESRVVRVNRILEAVAAEDTDSKILEVKKGFPLQSFKNTSFNKNGRIVEYCSSLYRGDKNKFSIEIRV